MLQLSIEFRVGVVTGTCALLLSWRQAVLLLTAADALASPEPRASAVRACSEAIDTVQQSITFSIALCKRHRSVHTSLDPVARVALQLCDRLVPVRVCSNPQMLDAARERTDSVNMWFTMIDALVRAQKMAGKNPGSVRHTPEELELGALSDTLWHSSLCCAVLCCAVLCCAVLCCAVLCCAVLCCAVLCCAVLCCAVLC